MVGITCNVRCTTQELVHRVLIMNGGLTETVKSKWESSMTNLGTVNWAETPNPHPASLKNLRKLSAYLWDHGYTNDTMTISIHSLANETGVAYKQVRALLTKRAGFVTVKIGKQTNVFYLPSFGREYPANLDKFRTQKILSHLTFGEATDENVAEQKINAQLSEGKSGGVVLRPGQVVISPTLLTSPTEVTANNLHGTFTRLMAAVANGERSPVDAAEWIYRIADGMQRDLITIQAEVHTQAIEEL